MTSWVFEISDRGKQLVIYYLYSLCSVRIPFWEFFTCLKLRNNYNSETNVNLTVLYLESCFHSLRKDNHIEEYILFYFVLNLARVAAFLATLFFCQPPWLHVP